MDLVLGVLNHNELTLQVVFLPSQILIGSTKVYDGPRDRLLDYRLPNWLDVVILPKLCAYPLILRKSLLLGHLLQVELFQSNRLQG